MTDEFVVLDRANIIGRLAHKGQTRGAVTGHEPYWNHPLRVGTRLANFGFSPIIIAAARLHDVIEDCEVSPVELNLLVGSKRVVDLVLQVTHVSKPSDGNRAFRRGLDRAHVAKSDTEGASIKCADIEDNLTSPFDNAEWAKKYFAEKKLELDVLTHAYAPMWEAAMAAWQRGPTLVPNTQREMTKILNKQIVDSVKLASKE